MALYAIGDIQGCHAEFRELLDRMAFSPASDRLWLCGDLVNRGPDSLAVLRDVMALGDRAVTVLGNHDLHLVTVAAGHARLHRHDTLAPILAAPDRDELIAWLTRRPLVVVEGERVLVHAGLLPSWTAAKALELSREVQAMLTSPEANAFLAALYGNEPRRWRNDLKGFDRLRVVVNACTRMRFCTPDDRMEFSEKRGPSFAPKGYQAWFTHPERRTARNHVVCGHWSSLDLMLLPNVWMLDSGCVWGRTLTGIRVDDGKVFSVPSRQPVQPKPSG